MLKTQKKPVAGLLRDTCINVSIFLSKNQKTIGYDR
jgi:hypothetical protein